MGTISENLISLAESKALLQTALDSTETNFRTLILLAGSLNDHINDTTDAHDGSSISIGDSGGYFSGSDVEAALQEVGANSRGVAVADVTLDGAWNSGATVDAGANTITFVAGHGLANGDPIEFRANTGTLPAGINAYTNGAIGPADGDYYSIINLSSNTAQLCATPGGTTPADITGTGTAGWQWRLAGAVSITASGCDLSDSKELDVYAIVGSAKKSTGLSVNLRGYDTSTSDTSYINDAASTIATSFVPTVSGLTGKHAYHYIRMRLREMASGVQSVEVISNGLTSSDRTTWTKCTGGVMQMLAVGTGLTIKNVLLGLNNTAYGLIRNGSRIIVIRRGA